LEELPDRIIIGRSAFARIGRHDAEKSNAPEEGKAREETSRARFEKLRETRQKQLAISSNKYPRTVPGGPPTSMSAKLEVGTITEAAIRAGQAAHVEFPFSRRAMGTAYVEFPLRRRAMVAAPM
jgi:hypothetical protein